MVRPLGKEDYEYGLEEEEEQHLIELTSGRRGGRRPIGARAQSSSGESSATLRWMTVLFLLALAGVYHLGLQEGKNEVKQDSGMEDVEEKQPWHKKILGSIGGIVPSPAPPEQ